jgi:hypothetical protein
VELYRGLTGELISDGLNNKLATRLGEAFFSHYRYKPPTSEVKSWQNSLARVGFVLQGAGMLDHGVVLEYQLPQSSRRLDMLLTGRDEQHRDQALVVELKQWDAAQPSSVEDCVVTYVGGGLRDVLHPSCQVLRYRQYLQDFHAAFDDGAVGLSACAYLHNLTYRSDDELYATRHAHLLAECPAFAGDQTTQLIEFMGRRIGMRDHGEVLNRISTCPLRPARKLLDHTAAVIRRQRSYVLLDEQQVAFNSVLAQAQSALATGTKHVVLIRGGPGTGKSVLALHLIAELCARRYNAQHATGSRAFTKTLHKVVGSRAAAQFRFFNNYARHAPDSIDVLVLDEAHRIRESSNHRYTRKEQRSTLPQVEELLQAARVLVVFIDDLQVVRPAEVGSCDLVRAAAAKVGASIHEFELEAQFRCSGSDGFVNWVDNTLGIRRTANVLWQRSDPFEFRICESARDVYELIRALQAEGRSARMVAGYCWPWSKPKPDGTLVSDVCVGDWAMPWNARPDSTRLAKGIPSALLWAHEPGGIEQIGCIYTAQGFEFDYVGVIFGSDLRYDPASASWVGDPTQSYDRGGAKRGKDRFVDLVRQTYRVLLTRGMKGCYVHFTDKATGDYVRSRLE